MSPVIICLTAFGGCVVGSLIPLVNTELLVISLAATAPAALLVPMVLLASLGQLAGQSILYGAGCGCGRLSSWPKRPRVAAVLARLGARRAGATTLMFASATAGLPPLTATSVASGMLRIGLPRFLTIVFIGRLIRYGVLVSLPHMITQVAR
jgi:membrane protein YqaA with SNARE-associated domain